MFQNIDIYILLIYFVPFSTSCLSHNTKNEDIGPCLKEFYKSAYNGEYNCTKDFDFFADDPATQQKSFMTGKACFLSVVEKECSQEQYSLLLKKYDQFLDVLTSKPSNETECSNSHFKYNAQKCEPMMIAITLKTTQLATIDTKVNDTRVLQLVELCEKVQRCMSPNCYFLDSQKAMISDDCEGINMKNSEFMSCQWRIKKENPDLSEYSCLDGSDFYGSDVTSQIEKFTKKSKCTKEIMEDYCGENAGDDFEKYALITVKHLEIYARTMGLAGKL